ncbi:hypothetical protein VNO80_07520 [Phaseolus coccineus]|uniref:Uncharacterized protein n=1 Tax=Phaseolus coccineus TaxID=3886 RepID=A0AAN9NPB4_PHACN
MPWEEELKSNSVSQSGTIPSFEGWIGMPVACSWKEQRDNGGREGNEPSPHRLARIAIAAGPSPDPRRISR